MNTNTIILIIVAIAVVIGIGYVVSTPRTSDVPMGEEQMTDTAQDTQMDSEPAETESETTNSTDTDMDISETDADADTMEETEDTVAPGVYREYDATLVANSQAEDIVLFFHADWCPVCRALDSNIVANAESIPAGVEIYKVDFDTSTSLKQQYGVTRQHSVITIAADGTARSSISHPNSLSQLVGGL